MKELKKPKFWNQFSEFIGIIISLITTCVSFIKFPENWNFWQISLSITGIFFGTYIVFLLLYNVVYSIKMYLYCKDQDKYICELKRNIDGLNNERKNLNDELKKRFVIIENLKKYTNDVLLTLEEVIKHLEIGILDKTKTEQKFLIKVHEIICNKYNFMKRKGKEI